jgi:hypothetical protein
MMLPLTSQVVHLLGESGRLRLISCAVGVPAPLSTPSPTGSTSNVLPLAFTLMSVIMHLKTFASDLSYDGPG